jgi:hypothetical protein
MDITINDCHHKLITAKIKLKEIGLLRVCFDCCNRELSPKIDINIEEPPPGYVVEHTHWTSCFDRNLMTKVTNLVMFIMVAVMFWWFLTSYCSPAGQARGFCFSSISSISSIS